MKVFWLEQTEADLPDGNEWLSESEAVRLNGMRFPKRQSEWRLGRWTAKRALASCLKFRGGPEYLRLLEIRSAFSGEPQAFVEGKPAPVTVSLSHRAGVALCTIVLSVANLGCDLEKIESRDDVFIADYFTREEQHSLAGVPVESRDWLVTLLWSAKESALKALHEGLRLDTQSVNVQVGPSHGASLDDSDGKLRSKGRCHRTVWYPLEIQFHETNLFHGCWCREGDLVRTIAVGAREIEPVPIELTSSRPLLLKARVHNPNLCSHEFAHS